MVGITQNAVFQMIETAASQTTSPWARRKPSEPSGLALASTKAERRSGGRDSGSTNQP